MKNIYKIFTTLFIILLINACSTNSKLLNVLELIKNDYVLDINQTKLIDNSIHHLLKELDSHTVYLTRKELKKFLISTTGHFGGIGISMSIQNKLLTVITPISNTPAQKTGIQSGDIIIKINNHPVIGLSIEQCVSLTKGKVGSKLGLTILRKGEPRPLLFSIRREEINPTPVFATLLKNNILYISIPTFNQKTSEEVRSILKKYSHYIGIILDLRYNPGGVLSQAIATVNMFINKGLIVKQKGRLNKYTESYYANKIAVDTKSPIVILINKGSASASEIVAGALQVHKRATLVGERSFGKGTVQTLFNLDNNSALKMTIAKYYLPNNKCIDKIGIIPDITVQNNIHIKKRSRPISLKKVKKVLKGLSEGSLSARYINHTSIQKDTLQRSTFTYKQIQNDKQLLKAIEVIKNSN